MNTTELQCYLKVTICITIHNHLPVQPLLRHTLNDSFFALPYSVANSFFLVKYEDLVQWVKLSSCLDWQDGLGRLVKTWLSRNQEET